MTDIQKIETIAKIAGCSIKRKPDVLYIENRGFMWNKSGEIVRVLKKSGK